MKIRVSLVHYLNAAPLGWAFVHGRFKDRFEVVPSSPALCADQLSKGEVDIGLIPSIEFQRIPDLSIIPGIAIACMRKVRSILLIKLKGLKKISSVALDTSSRTSVALTKILLAQKLGIRPEFVPHPPDPPGMLKRCNAALLIGDAALKVRLEDYDTLDLSEEWAAWQQKPFVFAFWACRNDAILPDDLSAIFHEAKNIGLAARGEIASVFAKSLKLSKPFLEDYLYQNIDFDMGPEHLAGLETFYRLAYVEQLIPELRSLQFVSGSQTASGK
jgi:chorismate dehydratase